MQERGLGRLQLSSKRVVVVSDKKETKSFSVRWMYIQMP